MLSQLLVNTYQAAWSAYHRQWVHIDEALLAIFRQHSSYSWSDTYTKVVFIDSVYRAGLSRSLSQTPADQHVATALYEDSPTHRAAIERLRRHEHLSGDAIDDIVTAHSYIL